MLLIADIYEGVLNFLSRVGASDRVEHFSASISISDDKVIAAILEHFF